MPTKLTDGPTTRMHERNGGAVGRDTFRNDRLQTCKATELVDDLAIAEVGSGSPQWGAPPGPGETTRGGWARGGSGGCSGDVRHGGPP